MSDHELISHVRHIGPFEIVRKLGGGGSGGSVFEVRDPEHKIDQPRGIYALKAIPNDAEDRNRFLVRFHQEFAMIKRLNHAHIIQTYFAGQTDDVVYFVMEHIPGGTLSGLLRGKPLPVTEAVDCAVQMSLALDHAHRNGIIHRDVKPSNILIRDTTEDPRRLVLTDFGTAKVIGERGVTKSGMTIGTPEYMAPEQAEGHGDIDGRADIYALGCVLFEALAGRPPFDGPNQLSILYQQVHASIPILRGFNPDVPEGLAQVVERMLAKRPEDRYTRAEEVVDSLNPFLGNRFAADIPTVHIGSADDAPQGNGSTLVTDVPVAPATPDMETIPPSISAAETIPPNITTAETMPPSAQFTPPSLPANVAELVDTRPPQPSGASSFGAGAGPSGPRNIPGTTPGRGLAVPSGPYPGLAPGMAPGSVPIPGRGPVSGGQPGMRSGSMPGILPPLPGPASGPAARLGGAAPRGPRTTRWLEEAQGGRAAGAPSGTRRTGVAGYGERPAQYASRSGVPSGRLPRNRTGIGAYGSNPRRTRPIDDQYARASAAVADTDGSWLLPSEPKRRKPRSPMTLLVLVLAAILMIAGGGIAAYALVGGASTPPTAQTTPTKSTATATATVTATRSPTATNTVTASTTNANAAAAASFRAVTTNTGIDGSCASGNQTTTFNPGQTIYINLCTAQTVAGPMTATLQQNGQILYTFQSGKSLISNSHYFYYVQHPYPAGSYAVVVTMQVNGQTGVARTIPITIQ